MINLATRIERAPSRPNLSAISVVRIAVSVVILAATLHVCLAQAPSLETKSQSETASPAARAQQLCIQTEAAFILNHDRVQAKLGFLHATQIAPRYAPAWFNMGVLSEGDKDWSKAEEYFRKYLSLAPDGPDAKRTKEQLELLAKFAAGTITPDAAKRAEYDAMIQRARAFLATGFFREAIAEAGRAQSADSSRWEAYAVASLCMAKQNKPQEAAKFQALAVDHAPVDKREQIRAALTSDDSADTHKDSP
jgi:tetratricopeptide (TPR) repeat protein